MVDGDVVLVAGTAIFPIDDGNRAIAHQQNLQEPEPERKPS